MGKLLLDFWLFYPFPIRDDLQGGCRGYFAELDKSDLMEGLAYLTFLYYAGHTLRMLRQYQPYTRQEFSFGYEVDFAWLYRLLIAASLVVLIFGIFDLIGLLMAGLSYNTSWYAYFFLGFVIYYLSIQAYGQPNPGQMQLLAFEPAQKAPAKENEDLPEISEGEKQTLRQWMEAQQPYLNPNLSLGMLARHLSTSPASLSRIINEGFGQNFNDFVNQYRVQKVIQDLQQGAHLRHTLLGIALDAGFNSKTTFNRAFKKHTSLSPQEYIKKNIKKA
ncbi:MAG: AraC family transcriptional regulator [Microscillaceae bacterium]|nr:AraC family transcriptional regulator [Microscillaceae bacterium]